jgi:hypothetical protein
MSDQVKINTLQTKIEYMILALGGKPDEDQVENKYLLNQFEQTRSEIKSELQKAHGLLKERNETI